MVNMEFDVTALGELLVDMTPCGRSAQGNDLFEANPGGAPCNVLAMLQKLEHKTAFIGKVGPDFFGEMLRQTVKDTGVDVSSLYTDEIVHTTLAFVHLNPDGDRDFSFYRDPGADLCIKKEEIREEQIAASRIFHFGTLSMTAEPALSATKAAIEYAEKHGVLRSFDPNVRLPLWKQEEDAKRAVRFGLKHCDVLKIADNELLWLTGETTLEAGIEKLRAEFEIPLILLSMGAEGSRAYAENVYASYPAFLSDATIDTTGAGDTFMACMLHDVLENGILDRTAESLNQALRFANAAASLVTTRLGALRSMPEEAEIRALLSK